LIVQTIAEWETVYLIASVIHFLGVTFYAIFASGEMQPWAEPSDDDDQEDTAAVDSKAAAPPVNQAANKAAPPVIQAASKAALAVNQAASKAAPPVIQAASKAALAVNQAASKAAAPPVNQVPARPLCRSTRSPGPQGHSAGEPAGRQQGRSGGQPGRLVAKLLRRSTRAGRTAPRPPGTPPPPAPRGSTRPGLKWSSSGSVQSTSPTPTVRRGNANSGDEMSRSTTQNDYCVTLHRPLFTLWRKARKGEAAA